MSPTSFGPATTGRRWTKIVDGIAPVHFARAVREDLVRTNLLFLGTEHGAYVSFDAGDHWQSLQLNLPDTPIRDLVVKDADVVLGTHGRGFWILDDIEPLRELSRRRLRRTLTVFEPDEPAIRGLAHAAIQYFLSEWVDKVTIEILDALGGRRRHLRGHGAERRPRSATLPDASIVDVPTTAAGSEPLRVEPALQGRDDLRGHDHLERSARERTQSASGTLRGDGSPRTE